MRALYRFLIPVLLILLLTPLPLAGAQRAALDKIAPALRERLAAEGRSDFIVRFAEQADLSPAYTMDWQQRGEFVVQALTATAARSQAHAKALLDARGLRYQTFIAGNELYVWQGDLAAAEALAALAEVELVRATRTYYIDPIVLSEPQAAPQTLAWGIVDTNADDFWAQFGVQGDGIVVANIDTGVQWNHPALDQAFKCGSDPTDPACWADPSDVCGGVACDNNGHGTHTMGTMVGDDDPSLPYQVGMAPNARWIACKGCESSSCSDYALNACADWILAPGGNPANRPHVVNNSWGSGGCDDWYLTKVEAWRAAGIFPAFSAGNNGPNCMTLGSPGDYQESFASAAHDASRNTPAFSSRGPSCFGSSPYCKPNISAPGVNICSSVPLNSWNCTYSGTSMASPHSAGAVALLWSCNPALIGQVDTTFQALQSTADAPGVDNCAVQPGCGDVGCNCTYGYGYLNVLAAGNAWCGGVQVGYLAGHVYDAGTGNPLAGATVTAVPGAGIMATTDPTGYYTMTLAAGTYDVTASKSGYASQTAQDVVVITGQVTIQDFALTWQGSWITMPATPFEYNRFDCVYYDDGTGASTYNQKVYCMGGRTGSATEDPSIWRYDPLGNSWADTGADMYEDVSNYTANILCDENCANNGPAIYVIGGSDTDGGGARVRYVQRWYPRIGGTAQLVASDPWPGLAGGQVTIPGACVNTPDQSKIYCFGGFQNSVAPYNTAETYEYDPTRPAGGRWQQVTTANLSVARGYIYGAAQGQYLYAIGGDTFNGSDLSPVATSERLNLLNLAAGWTPLPDMPVPLAEGRGFGLEADTLSTGKLYIAGGGDWPDDSAEAMAYDIATATWDQGFADLNIARRNHAGVYIPLCTPDPTDPLPSLMVIGGHSGSDNPPFAVPEYYPLPCALPVPPSSCPRYDATADVESRGPFGLDPDRVHWASTDFQAINLAQDTRAFTAHFFAPTGEEIEQQTFTLPAGSSYLGSLPNHPTFVGTLVLETDGLGMGGVVHLQDKPQQDGNTIFPGQADVNLGPVGYVPIDSCILLYIHNLSADAVANTALYVYDQEGALVKIYPTTISPLGMVSIDPVSDAGLPAQFIGQGVVVADQLIQVTVHSRCNGFSAYVAAAYCDTAFYIPEVPAFPYGAILIHNPNNEPTYGEVWYASGLTQTFGMGPWGGVYLMPLDPSGPARIRVNGPPVVATVRFTDPEGTFAYRAIAAAEARRAAALPVLFSGDQGWQTGNNLWILNIGNTGTLVTIRFASVLDGRPIWYTATVAPGQVWRPMLPPLDGGRGSAILWSDPPQPLVALAGAYNSGEAAGDRYMRYAGRGFDLDYVKVWGGTFTATVNGAAVTFQGSVAGGSEPIDYAWDFGDGTTGSGQTIVHVYGAAGTYTVHMVASNVWGAYSTAYSDDVTVGQGAGYRVYLPLAVAAYAP